MWCLTSRRAARSPHSARLPNRRPPLPARRLASAALQLSVREYSQRLGRPRYRVRQDDLFETACDERGPAGLVARAMSAAGLAIEVLVEQEQVASVGALGES